MAVAPKLTRLTHKMVIQLNLVVESFTICGSRSRRPVRKLLDTLSYNYRCHVIDLLCHDFRMATWNAVKTSDNNIERGGSYAWHWHFSGRFGSFLFHFSPVSIVTRLQAGWPGFDSGRGREFFLFATAPIPALRPTQLPILLVPGAIFPGAKRPEREEEIFRLFWNPKLYYSAHKIPTFYCIKIRMNLVHKIPSYLFKICFKIIFPFTPRSSKWSLRFKIVYAFLVSCMRATCSTILIHLDLTILIVFVGEHSDGGAMSPVNERQGQWGMRWNKNIFGKIVSVTP
jgi:hypothetical protein